jgi:phosphoglycolate phosphatase-like HAD superfamily hydrolase
MKSSTGLIWISFLCLAIMLSIATLPSEAYSNTTTVNQDPLPSWTDGPAKMSILSYMANVTNVNSPHFVEPEERIAVFDQDGTLCCEKPSAFQLLFMEDRVKNLVSEHPEWNGQEPFSSIFAGRILSEDNFSMQEILKVYAATSSNMTVDEYTALVKGWLNTSHPRFGQPYRKCVYQPMLDLLSYLRSSGFKTYIVTGSDVDFVRAYSESLFGIPPDQVVGSSWKYRFEENNESSSILKLPEISNLVAGPEKSTSIQLFIGMRPILAYGNDDADHQMLEFATVGDSRAIGLLNHHDDPLREYAYDKAALNVTKIASQQDWHLVSMKDDWKWIFPFQKGRAAHDINERSNTKR